MCEELNNGLTIIHCLSLKGWRRARRSSFTALVVTAASDSLPSSDVSARWKIAGSTKQLLAVSAESRRILSLQSDNDPELLTLHIGRNLRKKVFTGVRGHLPIALVRRKRR